MMSKILSALSFVGVIGIVGYEYVQAVELQQRFQSFVAKGPRFTAMDGQALCERVRKLETRSYGYRDAGESPLPCDYETRK